MRELITVGYALTDKTPTDTITIKSHIGKSPRPCFLYGSKRILPTLRRLHMKAIKEGKEFYRIDMTITCRTYSSNVGYEDISNIDFLFTDLIKVDLRDVLIELLAESPRELNSMGIGEILKAHPERIDNLWADERFSHIKMFATKIPLPSNAKKTRQNYDQVAFLRSIDDIDEIYIRGLDAQALEVNFES